MHGRIAIEKTARHTKVDRLQLADIAFSEQVHHHRIRCKRRRTWNDLGNEIGMRSRSGEHLTRFGRIHRKSRLGQYVFAGRKRSERDRTVHVRPRADDHCIDAGIVHQRLPGLVHAGNTEFLCDTFPTMHAIDSRSTRSERRRFS
jgi:hypothetical protein